MNQKQCLSSCDDRIFQHFDIQHIDSNSPVYVDSRQSSCVNKTPFLYSNVLTAETMKNTVFWDVIPCSFGELTDSSGECTASIFIYEEYTKQEIKRKQAASRVLCFLYSCIICSPCHVL